MSWTLSWKSLRHWLVDNKLEAKAEKNMALNKWSEKNMHGKAFS